MIGPAEYDLVTQQRREYVYARVRTVEMTREVAHRMLAETRAAVAEVRAALLLFEYELAHAMIDGQTLDFLNEMMATMPGMRIALVTTDSRHLPSLQFGTAIGLEAGQEYASFTDLETAEAWLLKSQE
jgi:hypothetical protein